MIILARAEAVGLGNELFKHHFFHHVTFDHEFKDEKLFYRLLGDGYSRALNAQLSYACIPRPGMYLNLYTIHVMYLRYLLYTCNTWPRYMYVCSQTCNVVVVYQIASV